MDDFTYLLGARLPIRSAHNTAVWFSYSSGTLCLNRRRAYSDIDLVAIFGTDAISSDAMLYVQAIDY
jgi:hypothetical protein